MQTYRIYGTIVLDVEIEIESSSEEEAIEAIAINHNLNEFEVLNYELTAEKVD